MIIIPIRNFTSLNNRSLTTWQRWNETILFKPTILHKDMTTRKAMRLDVCIVYQLCATSQVPTNR